MDRDITGNGLRLTDGGGRETYGKGSFVTTQISSNAGVQRGNYGYDMQISFDGNTGTASDNPMSGHANGSDIRPYAMRILFFIAY